MNASDYVNSLAQEIAATVMSYALTNPVVQTLSEGYVRLERSGAMPAIGLALALYGLPEQMKDLQQEGPEVFVMLEGLKDLAKEGAVEIAESLADKDMKGQELFRKQQEVTMKDPARREVEQQESAKLEAQWKETARADQEQREQAQRDADSRIADQLVAALQKDAEQKKADLPELSQEAQDQRRRDGEEQANLSADHAEQGAKQDKEVARLREQLSERYRDAPDAVKATHLEKFDAAAEAVKVAREDRQATEMRELVEKQSRIQASPTQEDPTRY